MPTLPRAFLVLLALSSAPLAAADVTGGCVPTGPDMLCAGAGEWRSGDGCEDASGQEDHYVLVGAWSPAEESYSHYVMVDNGCYDYSRPDWSEEGTFLGVTYDGTRAPAGRVHSHVQTYTGNAPSQEPTSYCFAVVEAMGRQQTWWSECPDGVAIPDVFSMLFP